MLIPGLSVAANLFLGREPRGASGWSTTPKLEAERSQPCSARYGLRRRDRRIGRAGRVARRGAAADRRDRARFVARDAPPRARRADRVAHGERDGSPDGVAARAACGGHELHLRLPPDGRGLHHGRPHHRSARRANGRHGDDARDDAARGRGPHGRARSLPFAPEGALRSAPQANTTSARVTLRWRSRKVRRARAAHHARLDRPALALDDVSLRVRQGEVVAVCGAMGSGRTALLSTLFGCALGRRHRHGAPRRRGGPPRLARRRDRARESPTFPRTGRRRGSSSTSASRTTSRSPSSRDPTSWAHRRASASSTTASPRAAARGRRIRELAIRGDAPLHGLDALRRQSTEGRAGQMARAPAEPSPPR